MQQNISNFFGSKTSRSSDPQVRKRAKALGLNNIHGENDNQEKSNMTGNKRSHDSLEREAVYMENIEPPNKRMRSESNFSNNSNGNSQMSTSDPKKRLGKAFVHPYDFEEQPGSLQSKSYEFLRRHNIRDKEGRQPEDPEYDPKTLFIPDRDFKKMQEFEGQYWSLKKNNFDKILFFKKGKFYELYECDADTGKREFDLKMSTRVAKMRMVGVPESSFSSWAAKFIALGYKVARVEQMETGTALSLRKKKGARFSKVCERDLIEVVTPGTITEEGMLESVHGNYLLAIKEDIKSLQYGICFVDTSTGSFTIGEIQDDLPRTGFETLMHQLRPKELVYEKNGLSTETIGIIKQALEEPIMNGLTPVKEFLDRTGTIDQIEFCNYFGTSEQAEWPEVIQKYLDHSLVISALGGCIWFLKSLMKDEDLVSMKNFSEYDPIRDSGNLILDGQTLLNLEILGNNQDGTLRGSLLEMLDHCVTPFGKRLFKQWLIHPLRNSDILNARLDAIEDLDETPEAHDVLDIMSNLPDLERKLTKIHSHGRLKKQAAMFDDTDKKLLFMFLDTIEGFYKIHEIIEIMDGYRSRFKSSFLCSIVSLGEDFPDMLPALQHIDSLFDRERARQEGSITPQRGLNSEYDEYSDQLAKIEEKLNQELDKHQKYFNSTAIKFKSLNKARFLLEIPVKVLNKVDELPSEFTIHSKTKDYRRYITTKIDSLEQTWSEIKEVQDAALRTSLQAIFKQFDDLYQTWKKALHCVAQLDALFCLTKTKFMHHATCRPQFINADSPVLDLEQMVHPCATPSLASQFIPNDTSLGGDKKNSIIVTGPNMGGKSTLLRQTCIAVIMAQMGAYVPAQCFKLSPIDRIFTRIGANDRIMAGESTFMVELKETSNILRNATKHSLVILDELGRGTSTFDGYAIAYSVMKYIAEKIGCRTLFSTHYFALTEELNNHPEIDMYHMKCDVNEKCREVTFLYKFTKGVSPKSYGLNVARMAGIPDHVIDKAEDMAKLFEATSVMEKLRNSKHKANRLSEEEVELFQQLIKLLDNLDQLNFSDVKHLQQIMSGAIF
eukprot:gb/GECH01004418.1/.p1 GENE.gb/GECH01004418.1/~~gb/GECH01004418.1/.p1  ORF type:complete len:1061 (+),score=256.66 gb/GECH01004418.1/:1-3183(+)